MTGTDAIRDVLFLVGSQTQRTFRRLVFLNPRTHEWFYFPYVREHGEVIWDRIGQVIGQRCPVWFFGFFFNIIILLSRRFHPHFTGLFRLHEHGFSQVK
ncbi:hypothetical protein BDV33DRAFT_56366 [Aspergillus novoparasiticus]|uniref:Uncharacterized protein n=1 Tax=Aspergillus novoparasiticus TaxID=986946 RepID=A0A5N6EZY0_9EURO|nr:hypothetical protein BDV33DRAFT_56366 [Aspergillus novoparasiticus]